MVSRRGKSIEAEKFMRGIVTHTAGAGRHGKLPALSPERKELIATGKMGRIFLAETTPKYPVMASS